MCHFLYETTDHVIGICSRGLPVCSLGYSLCLGCFWGEIQQKRLLQTEYFPLGACLQCVRSVVTFISLHLGAQQWQFGVSGAWIDYLLITSPVLQPLRKVCQESSTLADCFVPWAKFGGGKGVDLGVGCSSGVGLSPAFLLDTNCNNCF